MTQVTLRAARGPADLTVLAELAHTIWHEHYPAIIGRAQVDYMLARGYSLDALTAEQRAGTRFVLAWREQAPVGYAATTPDGDTAWLDKLYVHAAARGVGIARALCADAAAFAAGAGARRLRLRVNRDNTGAITAYERLGFVVDGEDVKDIGDGYVMDDYIMNLALAAQPLSFG